MPLRGGETHLHVLPDGQAAEQADVLEGAGDACDRTLPGAGAVDPPLVEPHFALIQREGRGDHVQEGGLAGAVGSDQPDDLSRPAGHRHVAQRIDAAEVLRHRRDVVGRHGRRPFTGIEAGDGRGRTVPILACLLVWRYPRATGRASRSKQVVDPGAAPAFFALAPVAVHEARGQDSRCAVAERLVVDRGHRQDSAGR